MSSIKNKTKTKQTQTNLRLVLDVLSRRGCRSFCVMLLSLHSLTPGKFILLKYSFVKFQLQICDLGLITKSIQNKQDIWKMQNI